MGDSIITLENIVKIFPGIVALDKMNLEIRSGEVHALIGENGAGKSTLIKVLTGVYQSDGGKIFIKGKETKLQSIKDAQDQGIACVYQELNIFKNLDIVDNLFVGNLLRKRTGLLDYETMTAKAKEILGRLGQTIDPQTRVEKLGMGQQQMIEIGKALLKNAKVLILDEPTASLGKAETEDLFRIVKKLKSEGMAILFVSHKLEEVFELCDRVTVIMDGRHVSTDLVSDVTKDQLITNMVGRPIQNIYPKRHTTVGDVIFEVKNASRMGVFRNISFVARKGECLGFAGLVGAGRTELFRAVFAADKLDSGELYVNGKQVSIQTPNDAIKYKIALLPEDRKSQGLVLAQTVSENISAVNRVSLRNGPFINEEKVREQADLMVKKLDIKTTSTEKVVAELSGGNQQKVVIGKWLVSEPEIYIFDEPTRGIDVGAKLEIYRIISELLQQGKCVIMISSELPEILGMCDRVIVMHNGCITAEIDRDSYEFNEKDIMRAAWGVNSEE